MAALTDAMRRARGLYPRSRTFQSVYLNGARAALAGKPVDDCPYARTRDASWARTCRKAWLRGYASVRRSGV